MYLFNYLVTFKKVFAITYALWDLKLKRVLVIELCVGGLDTRTAQEVRASSRATRGG